MNEINQLPELIVIFCVVGSKLVFITKNKQLEVCIKAEINISNDVLNEFENKTEVKSSAVTYR